MSETLADSFLPRKTNVCSSWIDNKNYVFARLLYKLCTGNLCNSYLICCYFSYCHVCVLYFVYFYRALHNSTIFDIILCMFSLSSSRRTIVYCIVSISRHYVFDTQIQITYWTLGLAKVSSASKSCTHLYFLSLLVEKYFISYLSIYRLVFSHENKK